MQFGEIIFEKALDLVVGPVVQQLGYSFRYKGNVEKLILGADSLAAARDALEHRIDEAKRNGEEIEIAVENWLKQVNDVIIKTGEFRKDERHTRTRCTIWLFPSSVWLRHRLGKKAEKITKDVDGLLLKANFDRASYRLGPMSMDAALSNIGYESFKSRNETMKRVMAALGDSSVRMIGIYGPGGVGKTTFVKEAAKKARDEEKLFNVVITISVTRNPDPKKIQGEIADMLGLRLNVESEIGRADRIRRRLQKEEKNTLVILDDLWEGIELNRLGIPFDDEFSQMTTKDMPDFDSNMMTKEKATGEYKGCKILLASRSEEVLSTQMGAKKASIFSVGVLEKKEAEKLFKKVAGVRVKNHKVQRLTTEIVEKCEGLPMAIVAVGRALANKDYQEWKDAVDQLKRKEFVGVQKPMEFSIKLSYDHLESEDLKSIFLLCARMGNHASVMDLVKYCIGLDIFQGFHTIREARKRIDKLIHKLKGSSLLLDNGPNDHLNMHDMVRDVALSIASKEQHVFIVRNGKIDEWPDKDELQRCTAISIHNSEVNDELPEGINCPLLKVFHIDSDDPSMTIPDNFFDGMENLRILILTGIRLRCLPPSIRSLMNLKMLCLEHCQLGENLSIIGELKRLRVLSFSESEIENLPSALGELDKLQLLDISNCSKLKGIPPDSISGLNRLEVLYMRNSLVQWETEGQTSQIQNAILSELTHMHQLTTLDICIPNAELLPPNLFFDKLVSYKVVIGDSDMLSAGDFKMPHKYQASRTLALQLKEATNIHSQKGIKLLFKRVENLLLAELNGVKNIFDELNLDGFPYLKHLSIVNNFEIEYIIQSIDSSRPQNAFPKLESLCLYKLKKLEKICSTKLTKDSFGSLKSIKISGCEQMKNLFSFYMVQFLPNLEKMEVSKCNSLEGIVVGQGDENNGNYEKDNRLKFQTLRSLTLRSLLNFTGFDTNGTVQSASCSVFSEQVEIPNLESLELTSIIKVHEIWSRQSLCQHSPHFCFQKLVKLNVKDCNSMTYLFTFSMASRLSNLKGLSTSGCQVMKGIFNCEDSNEDGAKVCIFPKLEEIQISSMDSLREIWPPGVSSKSFGSLISVVIDKCGNLVTVFPGHMVGRFQKLTSLKVFDCKSMEGIFDLGNSTPQTNSGHETNLQFFYIKELPNLQHLWNKDPKGILLFKNLQIVEVYGCHNLKYLFPVSVAKDLHKLQDLSVLYCNRMEEIISPEQRSTSNPLKFPQVSFLQFQQLPRLESFYRGGDCPEWPELKRLIVCNCNNLEAQPTFLDDKVICSLEMLAVNGSEWLQQCISKYRMHSLKDLGLVSLNRIEILFLLLHRIPNLDDLTLYRCSFNEVFPHGSLTAPEKIGTVVQLKGLVLWDLPGLQSIGFERDPVFQRIERLRLHRCPHLKNVLPASVSFTYLTLLEVSECNALESLMAFSTAKSLVQLTTMKVVKCKMIGDIVRKWGTEEETANEIVFSKLMTLELASLENLKSFCSSENCAFKFPSLEKLVVRECPIMKIFSGKPTSTPKLQKVHVTEEEEKWHWDSDLNATIQKIFTDKFACGVEHFKHGDQPMLEEIWNGKETVPNKWFSNLKSLVIKGCQFLSNVIPSNLLPFLNKLEELEVRDCNSVKAIYDVKDITEERRINNTRPAQPLRFSLKKLVLKELPNLVHVWNRDPQGVVSLQNLQDVRVERCKCLKSLFPESLAEDLGAKLETLVVISCEEMVDIIAKDEEASPQAMKEFEFRRMSSLTLWQLPKLKRFYSGQHKIKVPHLKILDVHHCMTFEILSSESEIYRPACPEEHTFTSVAKVVPNLERLSLNKEETMMICRHGQFEVDLLQKLKSLVLQCFHSQSDMFPYGFLQKLPHIEEVEVRYCSFKKIFFMDEPDMDYNGVLSQLKRFRLNIMPELNSIGFEHSCVDSITKNLEKLEVYRCPRLVNLAPSTVFFSKLRDLTVSECHQLKYLLTYSTAKSMHMLEKMSISQCESLQVVVAKVGDGSDEDEPIIFRELKLLHLDSLTNISNFYNDDRSSLSFPLLEQVSVFECPSMKSFCGGDVSTPKLSGVKFQGHISEPKLFGVENKEQSDGVRWEVDLNTTIRKAFDETAAEFPSHVQHLKLPDHLELLKGIWDGEVQVPDTCFNNLKSLIVEGCEFKTNVIPSNLLSFLSSLEELEVRNCDSVKVIFDVKEITGDKKVVLKKLSLDLLPNLEHVWNNNPQGIFGLHELQVMHVNGCSSLRSLFPVSIAEDLMKLENLHVRSCGGLKAIVQEDTGVEEGVTKRFIFPCLTTVIVADLPELMYFYPGQHEVDFPALENLQVHLCNKIEAFKKFEGCHQEQPDDGHQEHPQDGVRSPIKRQALLSVEKVVPNLEHLSLNIEDVMTISQNLLHADRLQFQKLKSLELQYFDDETTFLFELLLKAPNVEKLQMSYSSCKMILPDDTSLVSPSHMNGTSYNSDDLSQILTPDSQPLWFDPRYSALLSRLKVLNLNDLPELSSIGLEHSWMDPISGGLKSLNVRSRSCLLLDNLTDLSLSKCPDLKYLFTWSTARSLRLLEKMCICQCESLQEIVAKQQHESNQEDITLSQLKTLYLDSLPSLVSFYAGSSTLIFPSLEQVSVFECPKMMVFCQSKADTPKLLGVELKGNIDGVRWFGGLNTTIWKQFEPSITEFACDVQKLELSEHPELKEFWNGVVSVPDAFFSNLKSLVVENCEWNSTVIPSNVHSFMKSLKELEVKNCSSVKAIFDSREVSFSSLKELHLAECNGLMYVFSSSIAKSLALLETIYIEKCESIKEIVAEEAMIECVLPEVSFSSLKKLRLAECNGLMYVFSSSIAKNLVLLETIYIEKCESIKEIVAEEAMIECVLPEVSFSSLKELHLAECNGLVYVFSSSIAKSLALLETIYVEKCESIKEIVAEEVNNTIHEEIIFGRLKVLSLNFLSSLASFYEGNSTLNFPNLVEVIITQCPSMKIFSQGPIRSPMLKMVQTSPERWDRSSEHNLNHTIKKVFERKVKIFACEVLLLKLYDHPELREIFCELARVPNESYFSNLSHLVVERCEFLSKVIPYKLLPFLNNLKGLSIRHCCSVKEIFDLEDVHMVPAASQSFPLIKNLTLEHLPNLEHVLSITDHQGIFSFPVLEKVVVEECKSLKSLFPAKLAKGLVKLEDLQVKYCRGLVEIVAKDEAAADRANEEFVFPCLNSMILWELPELKHFYPRPHKLKWPMRRELDVFRCQKLNFTSESQNFGVIHRLFPWFRRLKHRLSPEC